MSSYVNYLKELDKVYSSISLLFPLPLDYDNHITIKTTKLHVILLICLRQKVLSPCSRRLEVVVARKERARERDSLSRARSFLGLLRRLKVLDMFHQESGELKQLEFLSAESYNDLPISFVNPALDLLRGAVI